MNSPNNIKAIIFDLDGLLIDSEQLWTDARNIVLKPFNVFMTAEDKKKVMGRDYEDGLRYVINHFGLTLSIKEFVQKEKEALDEIYKAKLAFMPGAKEIIKKIDLRRIKKAITTGSSRERLSLVKNILGISDFDAEVTGDEIEKGKPAPDIFLKAAEKLMVEHRDCVVLEDSKFGIKGARAAGMKAVAVVDSRFSSDGDFTGEFEPDLIVDSLNKLDIQKLEVLVK